MKKRPTTMYLTLTLDEGNAFDKKTVKRFQASGRSDKCLEMLSEKCCEKAYTYLYKKVDGAKYGCVFPTQSIDFLKEEEEDFYYNLLIKLAEKLGERYGVWVHKIDFRTVLGEE